MDNTNLFNAVVEIVTKKPGKQELAPDQLKEAYEKITNSVSKYCRLKVLPMDMKYTIADMVSDTYDMDNPNTETIEDPAKAVKSIKQGDTTIEFNSVAVTTFSTVSEIVKHYSADLALYRSIYWR